VLPNGAKIMLIKLFGIIHQLQNIYYELTDDILKRQPPSTRYEPPAPDKTIHEPWERRSGPGKYRTPKG
jgi:hypothetical protein